MTIKERSKHVWTLRRIRACFSIVEAWQLVHEGMDADRLYWIAQETEPAERWRPGRMHVMAWSRAMAMWSLSWSWSEDRTMLDSDVTVCSS